MSPPRGSAATSAHHLLETQAGGNRQEDSARLRREQVKTLTRQAHEVNADRDVAVSPSRISRMVRRSVREGRVDRDSQGRFIAYADPTGETAVSNVLRGGGPDAAA